MTRIVFKVKRCISARGYQIGKTRYFQQNRRFRHSSLARRSKRRKRVARGTYAAVVWRGRTTPSRSLRLCGRLAVVAAGEVFFEPDIKADEKISTAHFPNCQLSDTMPSVAPCNGYDGPAISSHDGLERQLDRNIEVRRKNGPHAVNDRLPISLERVCCVIQAMTEKKANKSICEAVQE